MCTVLPVFYKDKCQKFDRKYKKLLEVGQHLQRITSVAFIKTNFIIILYIPHNPWNP